MRVFRKLLLCLIAGALLLACALAGAHMEEDVTVESATKAAMEEAVDEAEDETPEDAPEAATEEADDEAEDEAPKPAKGYVLVSTATQAGWLPLPEEGETSIPLRQILPDGTEAVNTIHLTPEGVYMEASTCDGQDCVNQGEVTLDNRKERILSNMIICLPNQVMLQLFTPEEMLEMMKGRE